MEGLAGAFDHSGMDAGPRIRRLTLVPFEGPDDTLRRYRLARMDEIALATPPDPSVDAARGVSAEEHLTAPGDDRRDDFYGHIP